MNAKQYQEKDFFEVMGAVIGNFKESWEAVKLNIVTFLVLVLLPMILSFLLFLFAILPAITNTNAGTAISGVLFFVAMLAVLFIDLVTYPAFLVTALKSVQNEKVNVEQAFKQGIKYLIPLIGLAILSLLVIVIGLILFIIPGLIATFFLMLAPYFLVDKNLGVVDSMKASYNTTKKYWKPVLSIEILYWLMGLLVNIPILGWIAYLALFIAYLCLIAYVYSVIQGKKVIKVS